MEKLVPTIIELLIRRVLGYGAVALAGHGVILSDSTQAMVLQVGIAAAMAVADIGWSVYDKYLRRFIQARLEIMVATAEAQAEKMRKAHVSAPTATEIADRVPDPAVTPSVVAETLKR
jgi:hypothetical protein